MVDTEVVLTGTKEDIFILVWERGVWKLKVNVLRWKRNKWSCTTFTSSTGRLCYLPSGESKNTIFVGSPIEL